MTRLTAGLLLACATATVIGCGKPSAANITLRRQNQELRDQVAKLTRQHEADAASLGVTGSSPPTAPVVSHDQANQFFTVHGIRLGRLTGPAEDGSGLQVYAVPLDDEGEKLKAAGSFVVEAFDLAKDGEQRIGHWDFPVDQARKSWLGGALQYGYSLAAPWQTKPAHPEITLKVTFTDALTGRSFTEQKLVKVESSKP